MAPKKRKAAARAAETSPGTEQPGEKRFKPTKNYSDIVAAGFIAETEVVTRNGEEKPKPRAGKKTMKFINQYNKHSQDYADWMNQMVELNIPMAAVNKVILAFQQVFGRNMAVLPYKTTKDQDIDWFGKKATGRVSAVIGRQRKRRVETEPGYDPTKTPTQNAATLCTSEALESRKDPENAVALIQANWERDRRAAWAALQKCPLYHTPPAGVDLQQVIRLLVEIYNEGFRQYIWDNLLLETSRYAAEGLGYSAYLDNNARFPNFSIGRHYGPDPSSPRSPIDNVENEAETKPTRVEDELPSPDGPQANEELQPDNGRVESFESESSPSGNMVKVKHEDDANETGMPSNGSFPDISSGYVENMDDANTSELFGDRPYPTAAFGSVENMDDANTSELFGDRPYPTAASNPVETTGDASTAELFADPSSPTAGFGHIEYMGDANTFELPSDFNFPNGGFENFGFIDNITAMEFSSYDPSPNPGSSYIEYTGNANAPELWPGEPSPDIDSGVSGNTTEAKELTVGANSTSPIGKHSAAESIEGTKDD